VSEKIKILRRLERFAETATETGQALKLMLEFASILKEHREFNTENLATLTCLGEHLRDKSEPENTQTLLNIGALMAELGKNCVKDFPNVDPLPTPSLPNRAHMVSIAVSILKRQKPTTEHIAELNRQTAGILKIAATWSGQDIIKLVAAIEQTGAEAVLARLQEQVTDKTSQTEL
jgi:hypothetical protein